MQASENQSIALTSREDLFGRLVLAHETVKCCLALYAGTIRRPRIVTNNQAKFFRALNAFIGRGL